MIFKELNRYHCKAYLVACEETKKAIIIDPHQDYLDRYLAILAYHHLQLEYVADTHTHADHRSACTDLTELVGAKTIRHQRAPQPNADMYVDEGDKIQVGNITLDILYTPGHTPDSISFYVEGRVITGDVLLIGGTGRADFAGGNPGDQYDCITKKLFTLPDDTLVFPGHDYRSNTESTIGYEKQHNPRIAGRSREEYIEIMKNLNLELPKRIQEVLITNITEDDDNEITLPTMTALGEVRRVNVEDLVSMVDSGSPPPVIDIRTKEEYNGPLGHIPGSKNIPLNELAKRSSELEKYTTSQIVLVCRAGVRSITGAAIMTGMGFALACDLEGGMVEWNKKNLPVERLKQKE